MRVHATIAGSRANGPGIRSVIWVQGCVGMNCPGCFNEKTHSVYGGYEVDPETLAIDIVRLAEPGTEGVTVSGGEPLQQTLAVWTFMHSIKKLRPNWSIGMFSGYTGSEWGAGRIVFAGYLDWAVLGRYDRTRPAKGFCSSDNQELKIYRRYCEADFQPMKEVLIGEDGLTQITGVLS